MSDELAQTASVPVFKEKRFVDLTDQNILQQQCCVNGQWIDSGDERAITVLNPADGQPVGNGPSLNRDEIARAIAAAEEAWPAWRELPAMKRAAVLRRWVELMRRHVDDLAVILTSEQGKPLAEAKAQIQGGFTHVDWFAEECRRVYGEVIPPFSSSRRRLTIRQPVGVTAAITSWNFTFSMITRKAALALAELAQRAGFPTEVFNVVTGQAAEVGTELTSNPTVCKLSFTGSTEVGKKLMAQCAATVKKVSLELGGNAPFIVFADADLDAAAAGAMGCKFRNRGQTCICTNRILVEESVYDEFVERLLGRFKTLRVGDGLTPEVTHGPLIDQASLEKVDRLVSRLPGQGRPGPDRRQAPRPGRFVPRADHFGSSETGDGRLPGGDLRPGRPDPDFCQRGGGRPIGQRRPLRPGRRCLHRQPAAVLAGQRAVGVRHGRS